MKVGQLRRMLQGRPSNAVVRIVVIDRDPHTMYDVELKAFDPLTVVRGDRFAKDNNFGRPNGEGFYEIFSGDDKEVLIEAELVSEASVDLSEVEKSRGRR